MKVGVGWIVCSNNHQIYPPQEVSDVGVEDYEEIFEFPSEEPERVPTSEELEEINRTRREMGRRPYRDINEWKQDYRRWARERKESVQNEVQARYEEKRGSMREVRVVEEEKAFRIVGKRYQGIVEFSENKLVLKCPVDGEVLIEVQW